MFGSSVIDVAIGLAFLYLLLSLLSTGINEVIETGLRKRAKDLEWGIFQLLAVEPPKKGQTTTTDLIERFYNHPLISSLFSGRYKHRGQHLPSYIPSQNFALALMDLVLPAAPKTESGTAGAAPPATLVVESENLPAGTKLPQPVPVPPSSPQLTNLRDALEKNTALPEELKKAIRSLIDAGAGDVAQVRKNIEHWFDGTMDRVSGWYKRRIQWITAGVGFALAVLLNADTFAIADSLARDPALRASVTAAAEAYAKGQPPIAPVNENRAKDNAAEVKKGNADGAVQSDSKVVEKVAQQINELHGYGWPLGWNQDDVRTMPRHDNNWRWAGAWLLKFVGWVMTAAAITMGAPFWFDTLSKFMVIRSSTKPPQKST